jgi:ubiquinone/menaquinone biosynthesis C-methylase UbiE
MEASNTSFIEAWDTVLYRKFVRFRHLLVEGLAGHSDRALAAASYRDGERVLDIGCGFGDSTLQIASLVGPWGLVVGTDCSANFLRDAEGQRVRRIVDNAVFLQRDVEVQELAGTYDHAFSRFGTMFFGNPGAAMRNIRSALRSGGSFTQVVWRRRDENPWLHEAELAVSKILPQPAPRDDQVHCGPGPFAFASADTVSSLLVSAGFEGIRFERSDCDICIGKNLDEAVEFAMNLGPAGEAVRLAGEEGTRSVPDVRLALARCLLPFARVDGVWAPSSTWIVTARAPR